MQFDKAQVIQMLMSQGKNDQAEQADRELPGQVDTDQHADLLSRIGIDPSSLLGGLGGGGAAGALGGLLGGGDKKNDGESGGLGGGLGKLGL
jgi:hypothetical protein